MSSWDRSRSIPWSLVRQGGNTNDDYDGHKEEVFRALQKQMIDNPPDGEEITEIKKGVRVPYSTTDLMKSAAFGGTLGSITGAVFGFMDSMRTAGENEVLKKASNHAKSRYLLEGTTRSATIFGLYFAGFHSLKYGLRVSMDPGEFSEIGIAGAISLGALSYKPTFRSSVPYAAMLIGMDSIQLIMREFENS